MLLQSENKFMEGDGVILNPNSIQNPYTPQLNDLNYEESDSDEEYAEAVMNNLVIPLTSDSDSD